MVDDYEAREAVRQLMKRFDSINAQRLSIAYVLAERSAEDYAKLLAIAEETERSLIGPKIAAEHADAYAALDDPNVDWSRAIIEILDTRTRIEIKPRL
jgi:hypothetical protein